MRFKNNKQVLKKVVNISTAGGCEQLTRRGCSFSTAQKVKKNVAHLRRLFIRQYEALLQG